MAKVKIDWIDNVSGEDIFEIKRKASLASPEILIGTVPAGSATFTDDSPLIGNNYYSVQAVNGSVRIESAYVLINLPAMTGTIDNVTLTIIP